MEDNLKQIIRCTRDIVYEGGYKISYGARNTLDHASLKLTELVKYFGLDEDKRRRLTEVTVQYAELLERNYNYHVANVDFKAADKLLGSFVRQQLRQQLLNPEFAFTLRPYRASYLTFYSFNEKYPIYHIHHGEQMKQRLLSAIIWHHLRNKTTVPNSGSSEKGVSSPDKKKIRNWNTRVDEVEVVRKCGDSSHLKPTKPKQKETQTCINAEIEVRKESFVVSKLMKKYEELRKLLKSRKNEEKKVTEKESGIEVDRDMSNNSLINAQTNVNPTISKKTKEKSNKKQMLSDMGDTQHTATNQISDGEDNSGTLIIHIPANVQRITLIKNGCRISVEV